MRDNLNAALNEMASSPNASAPAPVAALAPVPGSSSTLTLEVASTLASGPASAPAPVDVLVSAPLNAGKVHAGTDNTAYGKNELSYKVNSDGYHDMDMPVQSRQNSALAASQAPFALKTVVVSPGALATPSSSTANPALTTNPALTANPNVASRELITSRGLTADAGTPEPAKKLSQITQFLTGHIALRLNGHAKALQLINLSADAQTLDDMEPEKCQIVYEDCKYSLMMRLVFDSNVPIQQISCSCNNLDIGYMNFEAARLVVLQGSLLDPAQATPTPQAQATYQAQAHQVHQAQAQASPQDQALNKAQAKGHHSGYETNGWLSFTNISHSRPSALGYPFSMLCEMAMFTVIVIFQDGSKLELYSPYLLCASKNQDNSDNIQQMLQKLADFDNSIIGGWLFPNASRDLGKQKTSLIHRDLTHINPDEKDELNQNKNTHRSLNSYLQLLEEIVTCYQTNLAYFCRMGKHSIRKETMLQSPLNVKSLTVAGFQWLMQNSDQLASVNSNKGIYYRGQNYVPLQMVSEVNIKSSDVYENHVVVSFLNVVLNNARHICAELKASVSENTAQVTTLLKAQNATLNSLTTPSVHNNHGRSESLQNSSNTSNDSTGSQNSSNHSNGSNGSPNGSNSSPNGFTEGEAFDEPSNLEHYVSSIARLKTMQLSLSQNLLYRLDSVIDTLNNLLGQYLNMFKLKPDFTLKMPRKTKTFQEIKPYTQVFAMFLKWLNYGEFKLEKDKLFMRVKTLDQLFEYYCLIGLLEMLQANGYTLSPVVTLTVIQDEENEALSQIQSMANMTQAQAQTQAQTLSGQTTEGLTNPLLTKVTDANFNLLARACQITSYAVNSEQDDPTLLESPDTQLVDMQTGTLAAPGQTGTLSFHAKSNVSSRASTNTSGKENEGNGHGNKQEVGKATTQGQVQAQTQAQAQAQSSWQTQEPMSWSGMSGPQLKTQKLQVGPIYTFRYQKANGCLSNPEERLPNTFVLRKGEVEVTLYYQPIISATEFQNRLSLYRTTNPNAIGDFYSPDFVLKFARKIPAQAPQAVITNASPLQLKLQAQAQVKAQAQAQTQPYSASEQAATTQAPGQVGQVAAKVGAQASSDPSKIEENYVILDSKFASRKNIHEYYLDDVIKKYSTQVAVNQECCSPKMVWILQGRVDSHEEPIWKFHSSRLASLYQPATSIGIVTMNACTNNLQQFWQEIQGQIPWI